MKKILAVTMALVFAASAQAAITTTGNVEPGDPSTWTTGDDGRIGDTADGSMEINGGSDVENYIGYIGRYAGVTGGVTVTGVGSTWTNAYQLYVGNNGTGTLLIDNGGTVTAASGISIAGFSGSTGTVTVTGANSTLTTPDLLTVGTNGIGTLTIANGGAVNSQWGYIGAYDNDPACTGSVTVTGGGSTWTNSSSLHVGNQISGTLTIADGGAVSNTLGYVGYSSGATGSVTVTDAGSEWTNSDSLYVGYNGSGELTIENGGVVTNTYGRIGRYSGSTGTVAVTGTGSQWINSEELNIGYEGTGTLNIQNGGAVSNTNAFIGHSSGSTGTVTVSGTDSQWTNSGSLSVGYYGDGTLNIQNGGAVSNTDGSIGDESGSTGTATVTGAGSTWTNTGDLIVGESGTGTLNVESGGAVSSVTGFIGYSDDTTGTATVTGTGSTWTNSDYLTIADNGNGTLAIADGGAVSNTQGYVGYGDDAIGSVTVDNGLWTNNSYLYVGHGGAGTLAIENGGTVTNTSGHIGYESGSTGTVTVDNGTWTNTGALSVGREGTGTLTIQNGAAVSNTFAYIGNRSGSTGTATVTGAGSSWTSANSLYVGNAGDGTLTIADGGAVSNANGFIGNASGVTGVATVTGTNSTWTNATPLYVGYEGTGTLNIENGGAVSNTSADIGRYAGSTGTATVDGTGSTWTNSSYLYVARFGTGTLNITNGGVVTNTDGIIGNEADSTGTATVDGAGSTWTNSGYLQVGLEGNGTLTVANGGTVTSSRGYVGGSADSTGTATVTGTGSTWTTAAYLYVGGNGGGSLTIADGGDVTSMAGSIATDVGTTGTVTVTGTNSRWTMSDLIFVGCGITDSELVTRGAGTLNISDGGEVIAPYGIIGSTSTLSGDGTLTLDSGSGTLGNHGTIAPGNSIGTLTVDGNVEFRDGSTLEAEIDNAGNCDKLNVTGDVTINNGSTLAINSNGETIEAEKQYTLIEADGTITGEFTTVDTALVDWEADVQHSMAYDSSTAALVVTASVAPFDDLSLLRTDNQRACGNAIEQVSDAGGDLGSIPGGLTGILGDDDLRHAYDQLSGQTRPSIAPIVDAGVSGFTGAVSGRLQSARLANLGAGGAMLAMAESTTAAFDLPGYAPVSDVTAAGSGGAYDADSKYGAWTKGFGAIGDRDSEEGVNGYDYEIGGVAAGLDYQFTENFMAGLTLGYADTDVEYRSSRDNSQIDALYGGLYGSYMDADGYIEGVVAYADLDSETDRYVDFVSEKNQGDFDGYEVSAYVEAARNYYFKDILVQPLGGFEFGYQRQDGYTEKGGDSALRYEKQTFESYKSSLGAKASKYLCQKGQQSLWAQLRAKWLHEFGDAAAGVTASFASAPGYRFTVKDAKLNRDSAVLGTGLKYQANKNIVLFADYDALLNSDTVAHVFSAGLRYMW